MAEKQRKSTPKRKTLKQLYAEHKGKVSDKWSAYLAEYEEIFKGYRSKSIRLLEIGVHNGGSLEIWSKFFPKARTFVGCDTHHDCARLNYEDPRIALVIGEANTDATQTEILGHAPAFDIIIDDGTHRSSDIVKSFARYFPCLTEGGVYVVEDLHCSYWQDYEGGLYDPFSSMTFFKHLADTVNQAHWGVEKSRSDLLTGFFSKYGFQMAEETLRTIHSIQFINSLCVIRKSKAERNELGTRTVAGSEEMVYPGVLEQHLNHGVTPDQSGNQWAARSVSPDEELPFRITELAEQEDRIADLSKSLTERDQGIYGLNQALAERDERIADFERAIAERDTKVKELELELQGQEVRVSDLEAKAQQVASLQNKVQHQKEELHTLTALTEKLSTATQAIFDSLTWRIGCFAAELIRKATFRRKEPLVQDHVQSLRSSFFNWKSAYFKDKE